MILLARRTEVRVTIDGEDVTPDINKYLKTLTYTDNEDEKADDLQIEIDDREGIWTGKYMEGGLKGSALAAVIVQKNWGSDGKDRVLDCGVFECDTIDVSDPPLSVNIKAASIPYSSTLWREVKNRTWENIGLRAMAADIAAANGLSLMYESSFNPVFGSCEQIRQSDLMFLYAKCINAGISLKVAYKTLILFDAETYEGAAPARVFKRGVTDISSASFSSNFHDTAYSACHVSYTNPRTGAVIEYTYTPRDGDKTAAVLEINEKVFDREEARKLAMKRLRAKNKKEFEASFNLPGDASVVTGATARVEGWGMFDGVYIITSASHSISGGYTTSVKLRLTIGGY
jgi:phage protein D